VIDVSLICVVVVQRDVGRDVRTTTELLRFRRRISLNVLGGLLSGLVDRVVDLRFDGLLGGLVTRLRRRDFLVWFIP
jgi:hypothetical protein